MKKAKFKQNIRDTHQEIWMTLSGQIVEILQNPCRCCPLDFLISYESGNSYSYAFSSKNFKTRWCKRRKWERLQ